jgi:NAD(P)-dependent dehydrogenase (short-subunit alcohol dehydrogenase family)
MSEQLAEDGHHVVAVYGADAGAAADTVRAARAAGHSTEVMQTDLTDPEACRTAAAQILARHGRIDYLINNAGVMRDGTMSSLSIDDWDHVVSVDLSSVFYLTRAVLPSMVERTFGRIVMIGSAAGVTGSPARPNYAAAKAGLHGLAKSLAHGYSRKGVTTNLVVVGPTLVGIGEGTDERSLSALVARVPLGRPVDPESVVHAVRFLLDDRAGSVTGSTVTVDGGMTM